jgi:hypothetical protein
VNSSCAVISFAEEDREQSYKIKSWLNTVNAHVCAAVVMPCQNQTQTKGIDLHWTTLKVNRSINVFF